jgi:hypothetical protein
MKITIEIDLTEKQEVQIRQNSIERVLNNAISVGSRTENSGVSTGLREDASTLWQDAEDLKYVTTYIWNAVRDGIFKAKLEAQRGNK